MFVFGINLPVAEILFVVLLLFIVALAIIIVQLGRMRKNIRVLDETTLEIRRYEAEEEITLKTLNVQPAKLSAIEQRNVQKLLANASREQKKLLGRLLKGEQPQAVKNSLVRGGMSDRHATKHVNDAIYWLNQ